MMRSSQAIVRSRVILFVSASYLALFLPIQEARAQAQPAPQQGGASLPAVTVTAPETRQRRAPSAVRNTTNSARSRRTQAARRNETAPAAKPSFGPTQDARTGTVGVYSDSTSTATKTNTRLVNIPQSITVLTKDYIRDQSFQNLTEATRYVPGVAIHQGEGNRDELVIRGVDSSANFYVNGFRDDVQYFRDLYNTQSIEILKGPSALTFGRGAGGGLVNRTLRPTASDSTKRPCRPAPTATSACRSTPDRR
jgi:catecholate siderophore receptor